MSGSEGSATRQQFWLLTLVSALALVLVVFNITLALFNADLRREANERQQFINQSVKLSQLHGQLVKGLATLSARTNDEQLRKVLADQGINFTVNNPSDTASQAGTEAGGRP